MYSFWSGELQGLQEKAIEEFPKDPTFSRAVENLFVITRARSDFRYFRKRGMLDGELLPLDRKLIVNIFTGIKFSAKKKLRRA
jgi:hypothetical protein